jgi:hypothetical protein
MGSVSSISSSIAAHERHPAVAEADVRDFHNSPHAVPHDDLTPPVEADPDPDAGLPAFSPGERLRPVAVHVSAPIIG